MSLLASLLGSSELSRAEGADDDEKRAQTQTSIDTTGDDKGILAKCPRLVLVDFDALAGAAAGG